MNEPLRVLGLAGLLGGLSVVSCAPPAPKDQSVELQVQCTGKCDGLSSIKSLYRDIQEVDLGDLVNRGAGFATDKLNGALALGSATARVDAPELYSSAQDAAADQTLKDLDALVSGLSQRYGEREFSTAVNRLRAEHLHGSADTVYAESAFEISASYPMGWDLPAAGFQDKSLRLGFSAGGAISARVIAASGNELKANLDAPLAAIQNLRGFVLPRSPGDLSAMKPGEAFALSGKGNLGLNLGAGVPFVVAQPLTAISYNLVLSGALRTAISGSLDVQAVRLAGDELVVDVGTDAAAVRSASVALEDGWGVSGLVQKTFALAGYELDLGRLLDKSLNNLLNKKLSLISANAGKTTRKLRMSVARLRFHLDSLGEAGAQALAQALRGDLRLAQALAGQGSPAVEADFDLFRAGLSSTSAAGVDLLGMRFFRKEIEQSGAAVVQTPGGARAILFDSLHQESGWFFSSHGYTRVGLAGLRFDPQTGRPFGGEVNLFLQIEEGDEHMERDKLLDHLDGILLGLGGQSGLAAVEGPANSLQRYVETTCASKNQSCRSTVLSDPTVLAYRQEATNAANQVARGLTGSLGTLFNAVAAQRIAASATVEPNALLVGPSSSIVTDFRLDDAAVTALMTGISREGFSTFLSQVLGEAEILREDDVATIASDRSKIYAQNITTLDAMGGLLEASAEDYGRLLAVEQATIEGLGSIGTEAIELRVPVDAAGRIDYASATARSVTRARADTATAFVDQLLEAAAELNPNPELTAAYSLLSAIPPDSADLRLDLKMDLSNTWAQDFGHYRAAGYAPVDLHATGAAVSPIDGGLFDVDALIQMP